MYICRNKEGGFRRHAQPHNHDFFLSAHPKFDQCEPGLPDDIVSYQNPNLGICRNALGWKMLVCFIVCYVHLIYFELIWCIFPRFGMFYQEKSGNQKSVNQKSGNHGVNRLDEISPFWPPFQ
jgi:hypothetical protein